MLFNADAIPLLNNTEVFELSEKRLEAAWQPYTKFMEIQPDIMSAPSQEAAQQIFEVCRFLPGCGGCPPRAVLGQGRLVCWRLQVVCTGLPCSSLCHFCSLQSTDPSQKGPSPDQPLPPPPLLPPSPQITPNRGREIKRRCGRSIPQWVILVVQPLVKSSFLADEMIPQ